MKNGNLDGEDFNTIWMVKFIIKVLMTFIFIQKKIEQCNGKKAFFKNKYCVKKKYES